MKEGEEESLWQAMLGVRYGAALVVLAFDEQSQAATFEDKVRSFQRSYKVVKLPPSQGTNTSLKPRKRGCQ